MSTSPFGFQRQSTKSRPVAWTLLGLAVVSVGILAIVALNQRASATDIPAPIVDHATGRVLSGPSPAQVSIVDADGQTRSIPVSVSSTIDPAGLTLVGASSDVVVRLGPAKAGGTMGQDRSVHGQTCVLVTDGRAGGESQVGCDSPAELARNGAILAHRDVLQGLVSGAFVFPEGAKSARLNGSPAAPNARAIGFRLPDTQDVTVSYDGPQGPVRRTVIDASVWR